MKEIYRYIINFLIGDGQDHSDTVIYSEEKAELLSQKIIIRPSCFFKEKIYGTKESIPELPLKKLKGIPILYGENKVEKIGDKLVMYADIVASSYFFITRYEEIVCQNCVDNYGRVVGKQSFLAQINHLEEPIVDQYGVLLKNYLKEMNLEVNNQKSGFEAIALTHDIDQPWPQFTITNGFKQIVKTLLQEKRLIFYPFLNSIGIYKINPYDTFDWLIKMDKKVIKKYEPKAKAIYFIISVKNSTKYTRSYLHDKKFNRIKERLLKSNCILGIHASFESGQEPKRIIKEKKDLEQVIKRKISCSRSHYLLSKKPNDMNSLIQAGITDDYTMAYADCLGFRLGTTRAVRWIDPYKKERTELTLHPLSIMDCTLYSSGYMNLDYETAYLSAKKIIDQIHKYNGELVLLWHNNVFEASGCTWIKKIYGELLEYICEKL